MRQQFAVRPLTASVAELALLAQEADPATAASALTWLGQLYREHHDVARARAAYLAAHASADPEGRRLAARGLGDLAFEDGRYQTAVRWYGAAAIGATGLLATELTQKRDRASLLHERWLAECAAWALFAIIGLGLFYRGRRAPWPAEALYVAPVYLGLVLAALGRDGAVLRALCLLALGSFCLIAASGRAKPRPGNGVRRLLRPMWLLLATFALLFAVCNRAGLTDALLGG